MIVPAYDDAAGVTAEFNRNVLRVINRELGADFDPEAFAHVALWDPDQEWIEMRLRADAADAGPAVLDLDVDVRRRARSCGRRCRRSSARRGSPPSWPRAGFRARRSSGPTRTGCSG